jgi:dipeptidyl aminopeptidase/acylaminoacyl peptidase
VDQISISHDGSKLAFVTSSVSERQEENEDTELYLVNLNAASAAVATPIRLTKNEAVELDLEWAPDNRHLFFQVNLGSVEGKYEDPQPRLYWIDAGGTPDKREIQRWFADYPGEVVTYTPLPDGSVLCACRTGTEVQLVSQANLRAPIVERKGWAGTYETPDAAPAGPRIAFAYSAIERPTEVYIADGPDKLAQARPITSFNKLFTERDLPQAKPYRWTSDDGTPVRGEGPAHVCVHPRRAAGCRWQPLRGRLVSVGPPGRHRRLAGVRAELSRIDRLRRQVRAADHS